MPHSILEAIKEGHWDFEPELVDRNHFDATRAMPGTLAKLDIMAERAALGLPLWHPCDRLDYDE